jgi:alkylated DNA nucleotide flippase Atl1
VVGLVDDGPRQVGVVMARNPVAIVVPCHRVVGARGALTGYGGGLAAKRWLLDLEAGLMTLESAAPSPGRSHHESDAKVGSNGRGR